MAKYLTSRISWRERRHFLNTSVGLGQLCSLSVLAALFVPSVSSALSCQQTASLDQRLRSSIKTEVASEQTPQSISTSIKRYVEQFPYMNSRDQVALLPESIKSQLPRTPRGELSNLEVESAYRLMRQVLFRAESLKVGAIAIEGKGIEEKIAGIFSEVLARSGRPSEGQMDRNLLQTYIGFLNRRIELASTPESGLLGMQDVMVLEAAKSNLQALLHGIEEGKITPEILKSYYSKLLKREMIAVRQTLSAQESTTREAVEVLKTLTLPAGAVKKSESLTRVKTTDFLSVSYKLKTSDSSGAEVLIAETLAIADPRNRNSYESFDGAIEHEGQKLVPQRVPEQNVEVRKAGSKTQFLIAASGDRLSESIRLEVRRESGGLNPRQKIVLNLKKPLGYMVVRPRFLPDGRIEILSFHPGLKSIQTQTLKLNLDKEAGDLSILQSSVPEVVVESLMSDAESTSELRAKVEMMFLSEK